MTHLEKITEENFVDAFNLKLAPEQERFVSHPIRASLRRMFTGNNASPSVSMKMTRWSAM